MRTSYSAAIALSAGFRLATAAPTHGCGSNSPLLFVTTYPAGDGEGKLLTLKQTGSNLEVVGQSDACGPYPSWLTQDGDVLYCVDEAWGGESGTLFSLKINANHTFTKLSDKETIVGPVSTVIYGENGDGLAVADYAGGGINLFNIADPASIQEIDTIVYPPPGDELPDPQNSARPHEAILDPTGEFLVFPDLGADQIRVLKVNKETLEYEEKPSYTDFDRGTGPRHGAFFKSGDKTFFYLVGELANVLQGFSVTYNDDDSLTFTRIYNATTHGDDQPLPDETAAAELWIAPGSNFLTLSSRFERSLEYTISNGTKVPSDPLITFSIDEETGDLTHVQTAPAGGVNPRHFSFNSDGTRVISALQSDGRVVVFERDPATGKIGKTIASGNVEGSPNFAIYKQ